MSSKKKTAKKDDAAAGLVPKLRFPEFREAEGWTEKPLKAAATINPANAGLPESFVYIDLESVEDGKLIVKNRIARQVAPSRAQRLVERGDIIYQVVRPYQRNNLLCEFDDDEAYVASTGYAQLRAKDSNRFLYQSIHTDSFVERVIAKCTGSNYPAINSSDLAEIQLPSPRTLAEQQKIASCLSSLDELIVLQGRKVDALKTHKKGLMQQLFPREGETQPRLRFPEFRQSGAWEPRKIGEMLEETQRPIAMSADDEYRLVTVKRRYGGLILREILKGREIQVKSQFVVRAGDFLISKRQIVHNACGLVTNVLDGCVVSNEYSVLTPRSGCSIEFFSWFTMQPAVSRSFMDCSVGIVIEKMLFKLPLWLKHEFLFPSHPEQQRIATCLSSVDALLTAETQKLEALKTHKRALLQQLFPSPELQG